MAKSSNNNKGSKDNNKWRNGKGNGPKPQRPRRTAGPNKTNAQGDDTVQIDDRNKKTMNDIKWYAANEQLLRDTASIPYSWATGLEIETAWSFGSMVPDVMPGICAVAIDLTPLSRNDESDPVNVAARYIVGKMRSVNAGAKNYDANDLMIRLLAEGEFLAFLTYATRIYATWNMYSAYNRYYPDSLMQAQSVDPANIRANAANFRARLNSIIAKAASIMFIPKDLFIFDRWTWLYANYYTDSTNPKDQIYFLTPKGYRYFSIDETTSMGKLSYVTWDVVDQPNGTLHTWVDICDALEQMLKPLVEDQDLCIMTGDMIKFFGSNSLALSLVPEILTAVPANDYLVLNQIRNLQTAPLADLTDTNKDIYQDSEGIYLSGGAIIAPPSTATFKRGSTTYTIGNVLSGNEAFMLSSDVILDTPSLTPTAVDTMEDSRLICQVLSRQEGQDVYYEVTNGSERVVNFYLGVRQKGADNNWRTKFYDMRTLVYCDCNNATQVYEKGTAGLRIYNQAEMMDMLWLSRMFDYFPKFNIVNVHLDTTNHVIDNCYGYGLMMRMCNYAIIPKNMMIKMNNCALLSEFYVTVTNAK